MVSIVISARQLGLVCLLKCHWWERSVCSTSSYKISVNNSISTASGVLSLCLVPHYFAVLWEVWQSMDVTVSSLRHPRDEDPSATASSLWFVLCFFLVFLHLFFFIYWLYFIHCWQPVLRLGRRRQFLSLLVYRELHKYIN